MNDTQADARHAYELLHGREPRTDEKVIFLDGNQNNLRKNNLCLALVKKSKKVTNPKNKNKNRK